MAGGIPRWRFPRAPEHTGHPVGSSAFVRLVSPGRRQGRAAASPPAARPALPRLHIREPGVRQGYPPSEDNLQALQPLQSCFRSRCVRPGSGVVPACCTEAHNTSQSGGPYGTAASRRSARPGSAGSVPGPPSPLCLLMGPRMPMAAPSGNSAGQILSLASSSSSPSGCHRCGHCCSLCHGAFFPRKRFLRLMRSRPQSPGRPVPGLACRRTDRPVEG